MDGTTVYDPKHDPRFPILTERFITNNDLQSNKRKETEPTKFQTPNVEKRFEGKVKFQGFNPHRVFHVAKIEHKPTHRTLLLPLLKLYILILKEILIFSL